MSRHAAAAFLATLVAVAAFPSIARAQPFIQSAVPSETSQTITIRGLNFGATPPQVISTSSRWP